MAVTYLFQDCATGDPVELEMDVDDAVPIGKVIRRKGRRLRRLASIGHGTVEPEWGHTAWGMSEDAAKKFAPRVDADGHAVFINRREIEETNAKLKAAGGTYLYDFGAHTKMKGRALK